MAAAQNSSNITLDYNRYLNDYQNFQRFNGISVGYQYQRGLNEAVAIRAGLSATYAQESFTIDWTPLISQKFNHETLRLQYSFGKSK